MKTTHKRSGHKRTRRSRATGKRSGHKRSGHKRTRRSQVASKRSRSAVKGGTSSHRRNYEAAMNNVKNEIIKVGIDCENKSQAEIGKEIEALQNQLKKRIVFKRTKKNRKLKLLEQCYSEKLMNVPQRIEIAKPKPHYAINPNSSGRSNISGVSGSFSPESEKIKYALFEKNVNISPASTKRLLENMNEDIIYPYKESSGNKEKERQRDSLRMKKAEFEALNPGQKYERYFLGNDNSERKHVLKEPLYEDI